MATKTKRMGGAFCHCGKATEQNGGEKSKSKLGCCVLLNGRTERRRSDHRATKEFIENLCRVPCSGGVPIGARSHPPFFLPRRKSTIYLPLQVHHVHHHPSSSFIAPPISKNSRELSLQGNRCHYSTDGMGENTSILCYLVPMLTIAFLFSCHAYP